MKDLIELQELVKKKGFGSALYGNVNGETVYLSRGIREVFCSDDQIQKIIDIVRSFQKGDYGSAQAHGKDERAGHEYGRYEICELEAAGETDTGVWVHRAEGTLLVYFRFER